MDTRTRTRPVRTPRLPSPTRERLLRAALERFWSQGYAATRVSEILRDAGANSGSPYHEFRGKEELFLACLDRLEALMDPLLFRPARRRHPDPLGRVMEVLAIYREQLVRSDFRLGSPLGNLAGEVSHRHPRLRERLDGLFRAWRRGLEDLRRDATPPPPADLPLETLSAFVLAVLEGAVLQARAARSLDPLDGSMETLQRLLGPLLTPGT